MTQLPCSLTHLILLLVLVAFASGANITLYLSNGGNDAGAGTEASPIQTLGQAWSRIVTEDTVIIYILDDMTPNAGHIIVAKPSVQFIHFISASSTSQTVLFYPNGMTFGGTNTMTIDYVGLEWASQGGNMLNIANTGSVTVTATNCILHNNTATLFQFATGNHTLNLSGCQIYGNIVTTNGGVASFASGTSPGNQTIMATNTSFYENKAANGAVFYLESTTVGQNVELLDCTFLNNVASGNGSVCLSSSSSTVGQTVHITQTEIHSNSASVYGGFLSLQSTTNIPTQLTLTQVNCTGNSAQYGGVVYTNLGGSSQMTMDRVTASNNHAVSNGGFANFQVKSSGIQAVIVIDTSFDSNSAIGSGGVFSLSSSSTQKQTIIMTRCNMTGNSGTNGGAIWLANMVSGSTGSITLSNCQVIGNHVSDLGGAFAMDGRFATNDLHIIEINNCLLDSNTAVNQGGVVSLGTNGYQQVTLVDSTWRDNHGGYGGAVSLGGDHRGPVKMNWLVVHNNTFENNFATSGGAVWSVQGNNASLQSNTWRNNSALTQGGHMSLLLNGTTGTLTITNETFGSIGNGTESLHFRPGINTYLEVTNLILESNPVKHVTLTTAAATTNTLNITSLHAQANTAALIDLDATWSVSQLGKLTVESNNPSQKVMTFVKQNQMRFEQVEWSLQNTACYGMVHHELTATTYQVVLPKVPCKLTDIPDEATGNITLTGNQTLGVNETLTVSTQLQIHVDGCVVLEGQLNLTIKSDAVVGKQPLITTSNPCLSGTFSGLNVQIEDNPTVCSAELEYSLSAVFSNLRSCTSSPLEAPAFPVGAVVGGVVGGVVGLALIAFLVVWFVPSLHNKVFPYAARETI